MMALPSLDAHAHLDPARTADELADSGVVLALTLSLDEAALVLGRCELPIAWGVGFLGPGWRKPGWNPPIQGVQVHTEDESKSQNGNSD